MPKRKDLKKILIIGAGPIVIGQACEFDYSGTQGVKALKEEGYKVILVNSNPATIMTDPELADVTYIEPIAVDVLEQIIKKEKPHAILPTLGGQTALNAALELDKLGILKKYNVELIGANIDSIKKAEDRDLFRKAMDKIGVPQAKSAIVTNMKEALKEIKDIGFPVILRPAFTMGGTGGNVAYNMEEYKEYMALGLSLSPVSQVLIDESLLGWKEYELEVIRDKNDNVIIICSIENLDPMGIHTGDSITVAPAQTLTDKEYQNLRNQSIQIIREIGVDTGGSNIQFAVDPKTGRTIVIEMNPRVSRSSALASKATGFPIAKIAAKLAVGYTLDELKNDITKTTPASFEPTIDYVVTKMPRFAFEKFEGSDDRLTTQMKSVGEAMGIGRTFQESFQKALRSMENGRYGLEECEILEKNQTKKRKLIVQKISVAKEDRIFWVAQAFREGFTIKDVFKHTSIDPWFLNEILDLVNFEKTIKKYSKKPMSKEILLKAKRMGFSDKRLAKLTKSSEDKIRKLRYKNKIKPVYKMVDTCAAEFEAVTPYFYSTYEQENESLPSTRKKVMILGGGPNRIGQGIEFDYCCCHACFSLSDDYEVIMVNCNPETVSTDYDTSDRLYFEPLTKEDVLRIIEIEKPIGVVVQFGGQTPLNLSKELEDCGVKILGTSSDSIDRVEDRERFSDFIKKLKLKQPKNGIAKSVGDAVKIADQIGYPIIVRPSYVLGGRAMEIIYEPKDLLRYLQEAVKASADKPVLIDQFLENAIEVDVDALCDGKEVVMGGIMEHIERAGIHSGDSACALPPYTLKKSVVDEIIRQTKVMALELQVKGLMNVQFAVLNDEVYLIEVNPRASRTVPFVSKATGLPLAKLASQLMVGKTIKELKIKENLFPKYTSIKEAVLPFSKFPGVDTLLGPEMKSTGEVMGIDKNFSMAFAKSQLAASNPLPKEGKIFISVRDKDKSGMIEVAKKLHKTGFEIITTQGTGDAFSKKGIPNKIVRKHYEGDPNIMQDLKDGKVAAVINTHEGSLSAEDSYEMRRLALQSAVPYFTTLSAAQSAINGIVKLNKSKITIQSMQKILN